MQAIDPAPPAPPSPRLLRLAPYGLLLLAWAVLLPPTRWYANPDGTSYVWVAMRWMSADADAVNGYWGPLLSWLMVPLLAVGVPGLLALRLVLLGGALLTFGPLRRLSLRAGARGVVVDVVLLGVAPFLAYNALYGLYPDVLAATALLMAADLMLRPGTTRSRRTALAGGALAGVAYLAKAFALPAALVLVPLWALLHLWRPRGAEPVTVRAAATTAVVGLVGVALVAGPWIGVLSVAYDAPTFSTSAGFNARLVAPGSAGNPLNGRGLYEPTFADSLSTWEEPSRLPVPLRNDAQPGEGSSPQPTETTTGAATEERGVVEGPSLDPVAVAENGVAQAGIVVGSVARRGWPLAVLALVAVVVLARRRRVPDPAVTGSLLAAAVWCVGLVLILAIERYLWLPILALVPAAAVGLDALTRGRSRASVPVAAVALVAAMTAGSVLGLQYRFGVDRDVALAADRLADAGGLDGRVAGSNDWPKTLMLCFELDCQYVGRPEAQDAAGAAAELAGAGVDHFVVWPEDRDEVEDILPPDGGSTQEETSVQEQTSVQELQVYRVTPDGLVPTTAVAVTP